MLGWLETWAGRKDVVTRNQAILAVMGKAPKKPTITNFDDVKDLENTALDPAIIATSAFVTNQSGFNILSKIKDGNGNYLIQPNVTNPEVKQIGGHTVQVIADRWLPDVTGSHPLY
ncbi:capsid protein, partial [Lentilactobacillus kefiri]